ncbi:hypothetical protein MH117_05135 [Paenibacillus sp. ACRRX]|uniref:hypothetical protein n=1 Tax=Paenibacillus sp. ACRRX TaxID=2918206 RepID=UPI001EF4913C|nr:hypothetical protein [Paenibacillus sp. ACRRX]MCG7406795.1 hypothetical protein [Paenibacillus sp. ACRRX]
MNKKFVSVLVASFVATSLFSTSVLASTPLNAPKDISQSSERIIELGKDEFSARVLKSMSDISPYISVDSNKQYHLDPSAEKVVGKEIYEHYLLGVNKLNIVNQLTPAAVNNDKIINYAYSNSYWWGVAVTYDDAETKRMVYALQQTAAVGTFLAGVAAFIPVAHLGSIVALAETLGATWLANSMSYHNNGRGVTMNIHWLMVPYIEITSN